MGGRDAGEDGRIVGSVVVHRIDRHLQHRLWFAGQCHAFGAQLPERIATVHIDVLDPAGRRHPEYSGNLLVRDGAAVKRIPLAVSDDAGNWTSGPFCPERGEVSCTAAIVIGSSDGEAVTVV